jgi:hypothetical protein
MQRTPSVSDVHANGPTRIELPYPRRVEFVGPFPRQAMPRHTRRAPFAVSRALRAGLNVWQYACAPVPPLLATSHWMFPDGE